MIARSSVRDVVARALDAHDRVGDELAGPMVGELAAAVDVDDVDAPLAYQASGSVELRRAACAAAGVDRAGARASAPSSAMASAARAPGTGCCSSSASRYSTSAEVDDVQVGHGLPSRPPLAQRLQPPLERGQELRGERAVERAVVPGQAEDAIGRIAIASSPSSSVTTTGRLTIASTSRIATCGWLMTGVAMIEPNWPGFVIVNVPPRTSSGVELRAPARAARGRGCARPGPRRERSCASRMTGTIRPSSPSETAMPRCTSSWRV